MNNNNERITIKIKRISDKYSDVEIPEYATEGSSGVDVRAAIDSSVCIKPKTLELIPTNLSFEIPSGYEIQVRPRSGLAAKHSIGILNSPGTIDSDYRGEVKIILMNFGTENFFVNKGDRIAQLVVAKVYKADFLEVNRINSSARGFGGFGHTGKT